MSLVVRFSEEPLEGSVERWNNLVRRSQANSVFLQAEWLLAWRDAFGGDVRIVEGWSGSTLVAAAAFVVTPGEWRLLGRGPSDYADLLVAQHISESEAQEAAGKILNAVFEAGASHVLLTGISLDGGTPTLLRRAGHHVTEFRMTPAPTMDIGVADKSARKKSLRRHTNKLGRAGHLRFVTSTTKHEIAPRLDGFFALHVARWAQTDTPSLFKDSRNREFYHAMVTRLAPRGQVRFLEVVLDGRVVAAHLGFVYGRRYTWYKPTFDPEYAQFSPGEVLLKRLLEDAQKEPVDEFDFTVGDESFKLRFATRIRTVVDLRVDRSAAGARRFRAYLRMRNVAKRVLGAGAAWSRLRAARAWLYGASAD